MTRSQLTSEITRGVVKPSAVIDLLLTVPTSARVVDDARQTYLQQGVLQCAWTGAVVRKDKFDVDHIIPFSLWHNNDLWNLVPASPAANSKKSDKLPTRELMHRRRDCLIGYWEIQRAHHTSRFDHEAAKIAGRGYAPRNWQSSVFQAVNDAIEFTAVQRGSERWQP